MGGDWGRGLNTQMPLHEACGVCLGGGGGLLQVASAGM